MDGQTLTIWDGFSQAFALLMGMDDGLLAIIGLSLKVSGLAVFFATLIGLPLGGALALTRFPGRGVVATLVDGFMGLPPVVIGLIVYLALSRTGPFGVLGLLYSPAAMIIAQTILVTPIIAAFTRRVAAREFVLIGDQLNSLRVGPWGRIATVLYEARWVLMTGVVAGFGRAIAEVGAVMIVGGNIDGYSRVMTTAIALETGRGQLGLALALGMILILMSVMISAIAQSGLSSRLLAGAGFDGEGRR